MTEFRISYDRHADVLYVTTSRNGPAHAKEDDNGIIWRYLDTDDTLIGVTIMDFSEYWKPRISELAKQVSLHFHVPRTQAAAVLERADV